jgi:uncharacterized membrane protein
MMTTPTQTTPTPGARRKRLGPRSIRGRLLAGLLIITPLVITVLIVRWVYSAALALGQPLLRWTMGGLKVLFGLDQTPALPGADNVFAVLLTIAMLYILGSLGSNVVGQRLIGIAESILTRLPFIDTVYSAVKRTLHALSGPPGGDEAKQVVVLVEFPYPPLKVLGFMTNMLTDTKSGQQYATVFIPTTPNPTSGYMELVPLERVHVTDWSMDQALSAILSGGASALPTVRIDNLRPPGAGATAGKEPPPKPPTA